MKQFSGNTRAGWTLALGIWTASAGATTTVRVPGVVDGFQTQDKDGIVDAALIIPTLSPSDVFRFDLQSLLGPKESAKAGPISAKVPGNTYIPRQKEKYGWLTITIEKPEFGFYSVPGQKQELSALWFSAPFHLLVDAANDKADIGQLLKASVFRKSGFAGLRDWSRESRIFMSLDKDLKALGSVQWQRAKAPAESSDAVIVFQRTPAARWALAGFTGSPAAKIGLSSTDGLANRLKTVALRSSFKGDKLQSAQGWIVEATRTSNVTFTGVPAALQNTALTRNKVRWKNPGGPGWMGVLHQPKVASLRTEKPSFFDGLFPFAKLLPHAAPGTTLTWVDPSQEEFTLPNTLKPSDGVMLIHVGTSRPVPAPRDEEEEPALFSDAQSLRTVVMQ